MVDEILVRKAEYLVESDLGWDDLLRKTIELLYVNNPRFHWVGIYLLEGDELVLHSYMGRATEHDRIPIGRGVCGTAVAERRNQIVSDVTKIENYLACSPETRSEIVVLIQSEGEIVGQIDVDSDEPGAFGPDDESLLNGIATLLGRRWRQRQSG